MSENIVDTKEIIKAEELLTIKEVIEKLFTRLRKTLDCREISFKIKVYHIGATDIVFRKGFIYQDFLIVLGKNGYHGFNAQLSVHKFGRTYSGPSQIEKCLNDGQMVATLMGYHSDLYKHKDFRIYPDISDFAIGKQYDQEVVSFLEAYFFEKVIPGKRICFFDHYMDEDANKVAERVMDTINRQSVKETRDLFGFKVMQALQKKMALPYENALLKKRYEDRKRIMQKNPSTEEN